MSDTKKPKITFEEIPFENSSSDWPESEDGKSAKVQPSKMAGEDGSSRLFDRTREWAETSFPGHAYTVVGGVAGLIVAIMVFAIGAPRTAFVLVCISIGMAVGQYFDGNPLVMKIVSRLFGDNQ